METPHHTTNTKWAILEIAFLSLCFLSHEADAHILVYRSHALIEEYNDLPAQFGPSLPPNGIKVYAFTAFPEEACEKIETPNKNSYPPNAKFVAIILRGGTNCTYELKVRHAQAARFDAVIVYNNEGDDLEPMSAQNTSNISIPAVFVGRTTGFNLKLFSQTDVLLVINDELPFNINTQLILPFAILIGLCFLTMIFYMIYKCIREERRSRRYRLPKSMLKKLPILKYTKNSDLSYDTCVICLEEFVDGDKLRVLPCRHPYHSHCIDPWLTENRRVCPICKRKVFTKGEARSNRNRQSSLDSVTDTDDDTTPLLQPASNANSTVGTDVDMAVAAATTHHGTFRTSAAADATSDDENALLSHQSPMHNSRRRVNPFDRSPNLPPHLAEQLSGNRRSIWSYPIFRLFRRHQSISIAAPPFLEEVVPDDGHMASNQTPSVSLARSATTTPPAIPHSANNILNPNFSGSFKDDDDLPHQSIYEPIAVVTPTTTRTQNEEEPTNATDADDVAFIQTPSQGGIGVVALPAGGGGDTVNSSDRRFLI